MTDGLTLLASAVATFISLLVAYLVFARPAMRTANARRIARQSRALLKSKPPARPSNVIQFYVPVLCQKTLTEIRTAAQRAAWHAHQSGTPVANPHPKHTRHAAAWSADYHHFLHELEDLQVQFFHGAKP